MQNRQSKIITIRFNLKEIKILNQLLIKHKAHNTSYFIKSVIFSPIKPFLSSNHQELLEISIIELNAIGRNLNQLLKYKKFQNSSYIYECIKNIQKQVEDIQNVIKK